MSDTVMTGIDNLLTHPDMFGLRGKRLGLITNCTGIDGRGRSTIDLLHEKAELVRLFAPEHGIRNEFEAGVHFDSYTDEATGVPVISLYGDNRRPTAEMLGGLDALVFDIQDVGARFYTYLYTMAYAMESCAEHGLPFYVLDRPNPIGGKTVEGRMLGMSFRSFIGYFPITQRYGLTIGETARLFNEEYGVGCGLTVVPMTGYRRDMYYGETGLVWVLPSPNIPSPHTCFLFAANCVFEGTNVSEGRGTTKPFQLVGAPYIEPGKLAAAMNGLALPGTFFRPHYFTPTFSKHKDVFCGGVETHVTDREAFNAVNTGTALLYTIRDMYGDRGFAFLPSVNDRYMIDLNTGSDDIRLGKASLKETLEKHREDSQAFARINAKYHLYE